jgi:hypothetical protein
MNMGREAHLKRKPLAPTIQIQPPLLADLPHREKVVVYQHITSN